MAERFICTWRTPWNKHIPGPVSHDAVEDDGEQIDYSDGESYQPRRCRNCGHRWKEELAQ